jgi:uncharacterized protein (TIGR02996 family)
MTEDETFIRAIVDGPGDETARLVYADWLDDRDDPRGAYLRAEVKWAQAPNPAEEKKLRTLARSLDDLWTARISRPPLGVCTPARFAKGGPPLTEKDLKRMEKRLDRALPVQFRAFLLNHNGGQPEPSYIPDPDPRGGPLCYRIIKFYAVCRPWTERPPKAPELEYQLEDQLDFMHSLYHIGHPGRKNPLLASLIPVADSHYDRGEFLLRVRGRKCGEVIHWSDYCTSSDRTSSQTVIAPTFAAFVGQLTEDREE